MSNAIDTKKSCILYIDDESQILLSVLELFEDEYKYSILTESSVQDGLNTLSNYYSVIDAVLLDLKFPNTDLQGIDALKLIKQKYPYLPVFILTGASNPDEEAIAIECLNLGASHYYHKSNFDPKTLIVEVNKAIESCTTERKISNLKNYQNITQEAPLLKIIDTPNNSKFGVFAYYLHQTVTTDYKNVYKEWSCDVLRTLVLGFNNLNISQIHYTADDSRVHTFFMFQIEAKSKKEVQEQFKEVFFNFSLFFNQQKGLQPGIFSPVMELEMLNMVLTFESKRQQENKFLFTRSTKEIQLHHSIGGFKKLDQTHPTKIFLPISIGVSEKQFETVFYLLQGLKDSLIVSKVKKISLTLAELEVLNKSKFILKEKDEGKHLEHLEELLNNQEQLLQLETYFYTSEKNCTAILNRIEEIYYSNNASYENVDKDFTQKSQIDKPFIRFPYIFTTHSASNVFRLPYLEEHINNAHGLISYKELDIEANALENKGIMIGNHHRGTVHIDKKQFQKHTYIIGKTGTGKTSVLFSMFMDQINKGKGAALIDPHGDIFDRVLEVIPDERRDDVIVFDPTDPECNFGFNILEFEEKFPEQQTYIVNELIKIFSEIYDMKAAGGPMFEVYFKNATYLVMDAIKHPTLEDIEKVFVDDSFRNELIQKCQISRVIDFFSMATKTIGELGFENFGPYITSKLTRFTDNYLLKKVICDPHRSFSFREMIDSNKIFLVKLNKGRLGSEGVSFIGRILFNKIIMAAYTRENIKEEKRKDFAVFVDEFQNFTSADLVSALAETRKYHLQLILANQTFAQLEESVARNILSNVGSIITAAISPFDADMIAPFLEPEFNKQDIVQLDNYKFIISTLYNNKRTKPFIFNSLPY